jgi:hypothetical protein
MANIDTAFVEQIFDLSQRKRKPGVHHHRRTDNLGQRLEISKWIFHLPRLRTSASRIKLGSPDTARHTQKMPGPFEPGAYWET